MKELNLLELNTIIKVIQTQHDLLSHFQCNKEVEILEKLLKKLNVMKKPEQEKYISCGWSTEKYLENFNKKNKKSS